MRIRVALGFAVVYLVGGSTYAAIKVGIETVPPLLLAASRYILAGVVLYGWARARGAPAPSRTDWPPMALAGGLLFLVGQGGIFLAERTVPSGITALLVATVSIWMVLLDWLWQGGPRPGRRVVLGLAIGLIGVVLLVGPSLRGDGLVNGLAAATLLLASAGWAVGSIVSRDLERRHDLLLTTGMELLCGGIALAISSIARGELRSLHPASIRTASLLALLYLILVGSVLGFSAYNWLLERVPAPRVATYAYVNPLVAVIIGWAFFREALNPRTVLAAAVVLASVVLTTLHAHAPPPATGGASPRPSAGAGGVHSSRSC